MKVTELNREQLTELKETYLIQQRDEQGEPVYMSEIACIDDLVSDKTVFAEYGGIVFTPDDFWSSMER